MFWLVSLVCLVNSIVYSLVKSNKMLLQLFSISAKGCVECESVHLVTLRNCQELNLYEFICIWLKLTNIQIFLFPEFLFYMWKIIDGFDLSRFHYKNLSAGFLYPLSKTLYFIYMFYTYTTVCYDVCSEMNFRL